ncbi:hypothetical protein PLESTB_001113400 [Pleodorina starrii]|uniref:Uncharacterized protein n=1 Tax=Pleodorina starrii TaxID=330485 RepID=A0A9W6BQK1_9CHLO|nr:hypothetical protein PLESTB_001113400 [Pleodorina starrii]
MVLNTFPTKGNEDGAAQSGPNQPSKSSPKTETLAKPTSDDQARLGLRERNRSVVRLSRNFTLPEVTVSCLQQPQSPRVP